jgi:hypothetical protein
MMTDYLGSINAGIPSVNTHYDPETDPGARHESVKTRLLKENYFVFE